MMRTIGRHFGVVKLVPLRVSSRLSIDNLYIISGLSGKGSDYVVLKDSDSQNSALAPVSCFCVPFSRFNVLVLCEFYLI